jgi:hypothetical protein
MLERPTLQDDFCAHITELMICILRNVTYVVEMWRGVGYTPPSNCPPHDCGFAPWFLWNTDKYGQFTMLDDTWHPVATGRNNWYDNPVLATPRPRRQPVGALW